MISVPSYTDFFTLINLLEILGFYHRNVMSITSCKTLLYPLPLTCTNGWHRNLVATTVLISLAGYGNGQDSKHLLNHESLYKTQILKAFGALKAAAVNK